MNPALAAWGVEIGVITIRDLANPAVRRFPLPSEFLSTFIVFGTLTALAGTSRGRGPASAVAWGLVVATFLSSKVDFLQPVGNFLAPSAPGTNAQAAVILGGYTGPSATGPGSADTGNILNQVKR